MKLWCCYVPNLRFGSCDLNRCKIEKITLFHKQGYYTNEKYSSESEFYIFSGSNFKNHQLCYDSCNKINMNEKDSKSFAINKGDVLLVRSGNVGDYAIVESEVQKAIFGSYLIKFVLNQNLVSNRYFGYFYESPAFKQQLVKIVQASANTNINAENIKSIFISYPSIGFQNKITSFLELIDRRIETQNKIIEKYESLKIEIKECIYLLSKEKEPLEKILHEVSEKSTTQNQYPVLSSTVKGLFLQNEYFDRSIASDNNIGYKIVHKGQIIISPQNLWMGNLTFNDKYENGIVSPSYKIYDIDQKYSKKYIYWLLTSKRSFFNYGLVSEQGASIVRRNLSIDAFMGLSIPVVKDRNCESKIEKLIDLIEKKLETEKKRESLLNQQKQFLLSNLFI